MYTRHFQRRKKERKEIAFFDTAIPPCSQWPSLSGKLHVSKITGVQLNSKKSIIFCIKWLGGYCVCVVHMVYNIHVHVCMYVGTMYPYMYYYYYYKKKIIKHVEV